MYSNFQASLHDTFSLKRKYSWRTISLLRQTSLCWHRDSNFLTEREGDKAKKRRLRARPRLILTRTTSTYNFNINE